MVVQSDLIKSIPYFYGLDRFELDSIGKLLLEKRANRGDILCIEGEPADTLYFVAAGAVKVYKVSVDGKEQILCIIRPGESFNDVPVLMGGSNLANAEALGEVVLYMIKKHDLNSVLTDHPKIALNVIRILSQRVQHMVSLVYGGVNAFN